MIHISPPLIGGGKWQTGLPLNYYSAARKKNYVVDAGFTTDLASVPRWLPLTYAIFGGEAPAAAVVHDWLYRYGKRYRQIADREEADDVFYEAMLDTGVPNWKAAVMHAAVRLFGAKSFVDAADGNSRLRA